MKTTNGIVTQYVYGLGLIREEKEGKFKAYHYDYRGSTVAITGISGNITDTFNIVFMVRYNAGEKRWKTKIIL